MGYPTYDKPGEQHVRREETLAEFTDNMRFRPAKGAQAEIYEENRERVIALATYVFDALPRVPERTLVRRHLEDALMRMNQIVAVHGVGLSDQQ